MNNLLSTGNKIKICVITNFVLVIVFQILVTLDIQMY